MRLAVPFLALLGALPGVALGQTRPDQEYRDTEVDEAEDPLTVKGLFETEYYEFDNLDFRKLDESSDQAILDSDDRGAFAFTGANLELGYQIDPQVKFVISAGHRGLWGDDQLGSVNSFGGFLYIPSLFVDLATAPENGVNFRVGRQFYQIGGMGGARDYVLADVLDMVRVDVPLPGEVGSVTVIPMNVFSVASEYNEVNFIGLLGQQNAETYEFRGDTLTRRYGAVLNLDGLPVPVGGALYGFYSDVGARGTGSDISYDGQLGNFADNDWVANFGLRANVELGPATLFGHFDGSTGIDRKELVAGDADTTGFAYGGGVRVDTTDEESGAGLVAEARYFDAFGPAYAESGLIYSHGFVGMKGQQAGGTLLNRFMGWHPTAYLGRNGVSNSPQNLERIAGTNVISATAAYTLPVGFTVEAGWWFMRDSGLTSVNFGDLDNLQPPFGYSRSEFEAQKRLGGVLGNELDLEVGQRFGDHVQLYLNGAIVLPGAFYATPIDRVAGTALGSNDPVNPWSVFGGTRVDF